MTRLFWYDLYFHMFIWTDVNGATNTSMKYKNTKYNAKLKCYEKVEYKTNLKMVGI